MTKLKFIAALAAMTVCLGMFSACSENNSESDKDEKENSSVTQTESDNSSENSSEDSEESSEDSSENSSEESSEDSSDSENSSETEETSDITPAMWLVTSPEGNTMVCLGSMHALTDEDYPLPKELTDAYNSADILAVECDITGVATDLAYQSQLLKAMILPDEGDTVDKHISEEGYSIMTDRFAEFNITIDSFKRYEPWALYNMYDSMILQSSGLDSNLGIDGKLLASAHDTGKEIYEVESVDFQMDMLMNMSDEIYDLIFRSLEEETTQTQVDQLNELYQAWRTGDVEKIGELDEMDYEEMTAEDIAIYEEYNSIMLTNRNKTMVEAVENLLAEGKNVFYVVGAAHYVGEDGIINLLENDGYTCERIEYTSNN